MKTALTTLENHGITSFFTILFTERRVDLSMDNGIFPLRKYDLVICRENIVWNASNEIHVLTFSKSIFDELFYTQIADCKIFYDFLHTKSKASEYLYFSCAKDLQSIQLLHLLQDELKRKDVYHNKMTNAFLTILLTSLDRSRHSTLHLANSTMVSDHIFGQILKYMGDHYVSCSMKEIAEVYGYHPDYLSAYFKKITGVTFRHKLLSIRLEKAEELLLTTDYTVEQIALKVGFQDKSWFQKKFKEHYQQTPAIYRKQNK